MREAASSLPPLELARGKDGSPRPLRSLARLLLALAAEELQAEQLSVGEGGNDAGRLEEGGRASVRTGTQGKVL